MKRGESNSRVTGSAIAASYLQEHLGESGAAARRFMMNCRRYVIAAIVAVVLLAGLTLVLAKRHEAGSAANTSRDVASTSSSASVGSSEETTVYAHNLRLRKGPAFQVYVRWLRGQMVRTRADRNPSLDNEESFIFAIDNGLIRANLEDIQKYLNLTLPQKAPLKNIALSGEGNGLKISGTLHKLLVPLPVELHATLSPTQDGRIHLHVTKIDVLKMPVKGLMGGLKLNIKDVVGPAPVDGVEISGDDLFLNTTTLLPPPHIRGKVTSIAVQPPDLVVIYGNTPNDEGELAQWHNFLRLRGGTVEFGKLTMQQADVTLIDASDEPWFDLDLANYQAQLLKGYSRITPERGLEMYMPGVGAPMPVGAVPLETLKNKNKPLPAAPKPK